MNDDNSKIGFEFLLEEYKELNNTLHKNEERGEKRLEFFVTLSSIVLGAVGLLLKDIDKYATYSSLLFAIILLLFLGLMLIGYITQQRLKKRNRITDGLKDDIATIRSLFKKHSKVIPAGYAPFVPTHHSVAGRDEKKFTSLFHIAFVINCVLAGAIAAITVFLLNAPQLMVYSTAITVAVAFGYFNYLKFNKHIPFTHAGGLVYKEDAGEIKYLLVTASNNPLKFILPKGHIEPGETPGMAAIREVMEEAGVLAKIEKELAVQNFQKAVETVKVKYFLMQFVQNVEATEKRQKLWLTKTEAIEKVSFAEAKELFAMV